MAEQQSLADKNAAYIAKMRSMASNNKTNDFKSDFDSQPQKKISLFNNKPLPNTKVEQSKKKKNKVQLPDTGLTETQLLTQYEIKSDKIGSGAFANIKVVKEHQTGKHFALKYVETKRKTAANINAFKKEILFLFKLTNHPNVIRMYDFCESPLGLYMVLEYCNGGDVAQQLKKKKTFSEAETKHISKQIVAGLCYLHQFNIVHRDIKPDNLMINNGILKIIDFGMAADCTNTPLTDSCGTPHFAAPEVISAMNYDMKADMWSLGVCMFLFICGQFPFFEKTGNQQKLLEVIKRGRFCFVDKYFNSCHPLLKDLISKLLCLQVTQRLNAQQTRNHQWFAVGGSQGSNGQKFGRQSVGVNQMKNNRDRQQSAPVPVNRNSFGRQRSAPAPVVDNKGAFGRHSAPFKGSGNNNANQSNNNSKKKNNNMQQRYNNVNVAEQHKNMNNVNKNANNNKKNNNMQQRYSNQPNNNMNKKMNNSQPNNLNNKMNKNLNKNDNMNNSNRNTNINKNMNNNLNQNTNNNMTKNMNNKNNKNMQQRYSNQPNNLNNKMNKNTNNNMTKNMNNNNKNTNSNVPRQKSVPFNNNNKNMNKNMNNNMKQQRNNNFMRQKGQNNQQFGRNKNMNMQPANNKNMNRNNHGVGQQNNIKAAPKHGNEDKPAVGAKTANINNNNQKGLPVAQPFHIKK